MPEVANALPRGYALHEYRIDSVLGAGGFGLTYLATDANLNLKVALKEYLPGDFASRGEDSSVQPKSESTAESRSESTRLNSSHIQKSRMPSSA